jgi:signal transduction histidine kinase
MGAEASKNLKDRKEIILRVWEDRALKEVPSAGTAETLALRDSLPIYLEHLSEALASNRKMDVRSVLIHDNESIRIGKLHGEDRAGTPSYILTEVIFEYHILREVIFETLETEGPLSTSHRDIIFSSIEQAVNDAAVKFSEVHADIQQKFVSTLTHDLKTPISAAKMAAQLILKRSDKPDDCIRSAGRIVGNLNRLDSMIHNLLDASRLRTGETLSLQFVHCDLSAIARDVVEELSDIHGSRITLEGKDSVEGVFGCDGFRRAIENLIGNAVKYGTQGSPVKVSISGDDKSVNFSVHNEGSPIPEEEIPLLFKQYRRSKSAHESRQTGWGLGLTLVKGVADAHGGKVIVRSPEGQGTTFVLSLPMKRE